MSHRVQTAAQTARFLGTMYARRGVLYYNAQIRGDLFSQLNRPGGRADPYVIYEKMRDKGPLLQTRLGNYSTTSHRLCSEVLRSRSFAVTPEDGSPDLAHQEFMDLSLLEINPPDHTRIRRLAAPAFTPRRMEGFTALVDAAIDRLLDDLAARREVDLMTAFASPLPIAVMAQLLGLPDEPERFRRLGATIGRALDGIWSIRQARVTASAQRELIGIFAELIERRAAEPGDDLVSALLAHQGDRLTAQELSALVRLLLVAGFETTVNAIGNGMHWLLADRAQWDLLVAEPERAGAVAEEVLRFEPPVQQTARVAITDVDVGGVELAKNQWVVTLLGAANRDPAVFPDPNRFDIARVSSAEHLAFSGGIHYCLGSPLARLELSRAFRALAERYPSIQLNGPVVMRPGTTLRGPQVLPVRVT